MRSARRRSVLLACVIMGAAAGSPRPSPALGAAGLYCGDPVWVGSIELNFVHDCNGIYPDAGCYRTLDFEYHMVGCETSPQFVGGCDPDTCWMTGPN